MKTIDETPDVWVVLKITSPQHGTVYKLLSGWFAGYLGSDEWRINSGIDLIEELSDCYIVTGSSGTVYKCYKACERLSGYTSSIYVGLQKDISSRPECSVEIVKMQDIKL